MRATLPARGFFYFISLGELDKYGKIIYCSITYHLPTQRRREMGALQIHALPGNLVATITTGDSQEAWQFVGSLVQGNLGREEAFIDVSWYEATLCVKGGTVVLTILGWSNEPTRGRSNGLHRTLVVESFDADRPTWQSQNAGILALLGFGDESQIERTLLRKWSPYTFTKPSH